MVEELRTELVNEINHEIINDGLIVTEKHKVRYEPAYIIGLFLSKEQTVANLVARQAQLIRQLNGLVNDYRAISKRVKKERENISNLREAFEAFRKKISKNGLLIPYLSDERPSYKRDVARVLKEVEREYVKNRELLVKGLGGLPSEVKGLLEREQ